MVSVIVPIYNVEKYLKQCIESILNQTFYDFELILVEDGSPDSCCKICDNYHLLDSRIVVIHKENGGLSDARNAGLEIAKGEYIVFVDSDDWIEPQYLEILYNKISEYNADIVICGYYITDENGNIEKNIVTKKEYILDSNQALNELVKDKKIENYAWNKIYKYSLFKNIRYPVGKIFEDIYTTYKLFLLASKIGVINFSLYNYRHRLGSIMSGLSISRQNAIFDAQMHRFDDLAPRKELIKPMYEAIIIVYINSFAVVAKTSHDKQNIVLYQMKKHINELTQMYKLNPKLTGKSKIIYFFIRYFPSIARLIFRF